MQGSSYVLTPEKVVIVRRFAALPVRVAAHAIDLVLAIGFAAITSTVVGSVGAVAGNEAGAALEALAAMVGLLAYFVLQEWLWQGRTVGKAAVNLRVVMTDGTPPTLLAVTYRNLLRIVDMLPIGYAIGIAVILANPRGQRLGDIVADTVLVSDSGIPTGFVPAPHHAGIHPLEHTLPTLDKMTLPEYFALKRLCDRFPDLLPETQARGIKEIWAPFAQVQQIEPLPNVHPIYQIEAVVMKYGRVHNLLLTAAENLGTDL